MANNEPLHETLNVSIVDLAASDPSEWKLIPGRATPPTLRPHAGRYVTHRMVRAFSPLMGVTCGAEGKRLKYTAWEGDITCLKCLALSPKD